MQFLRWICWKELTGLWCAGQWTLVSCLLFLLPHPWFCSSVSVWSLTCYVAVPWFCCVLSARISGVHSLLIISLSLPLSPAHLLLCCPECPCALVSTWWWVSFHHWLGWPCIGCHGTCPSGSVLVVNGRLMLCGWLHDCLPPVTWSPPFSFF